MANEETAVRRQIVREYQRILRDAERICRETHEDRDSTPRQRDLADNNLWNCREGLAMTWAAMLPGEEMTA